MPEENDPFARIERRLELHEYERIEDRVEAYGEMLRDVYEVLRILRDETSRLRRGEAPAGTTVRIP